MVKAIILAAGEGTRLRPITETRPKSMIPILCKPILEWHINALFRAGVEEIYVVVGYLKEHILRFLSSRGFYNGRVKVIEQGDLKGTGDAMLKATSEIGYGDEVVITYADLFIEDWDIISRLTREQENTVLGVVVENPRDYGVLYTRDHYLLRVVEKPDEPKSNLVNAGIYKLSTTDILENKDIEPSPRGEIEATDLLNKITSKKPIRIALYEKKWIDIGKPWHVIDANKVALRNIIRLVRGKILEPVYIDGDIFIDEDTTIYPYSTIQGPVYIGRNVEIGPNAYIRPWSVICDYSKIGFSVEVKESIIFENVHAHHLAYIGDSVICENTNLGAGTILANLRHDEKTVKMMVKNLLEDTGRRKLGAIIGANVKTGVNVSIMPGVKIGSYSWILPGTVVYRDVERNTIYPQYTKNKHE
ncbi:MAG: sugar phosphate nucleotidyltransferase [Desulfurococcaceae archaeon]